MGMFDFLKDNSKSEHQENVEYYLAGQPDDDVIELTDDMRVLKPGEHLSAGEIKQRCEAVLAKRPVILADPDNSWSMHHCTAIECGKMVNGCCMAYMDPTKLMWHKQGDECPTGPYQASAMKAHAALSKKLNPLKASKRKEG